MGFQIEMGSVWNDLHALMSDVVEQMNHTPEIKQLADSTFNAD